MGQPDRERDDEPGLDEHHQPDPEHLAAQELSGSDGREQDLDHAARLLLHHPDEHPRVVLGQHQEQEDQTGDRGASGRGADAARLEAPHRERLGAGERGDLGRRQSGGSHRLVGPNRPGERPGELSRGRGVGRRHRLHHPHLAAVDDGHVDSTGAQIGTRRRRVGHRNQVDAVADARARREQGAARRPRRRTDDANPLGVLTPLEHRNHDRGGRSSQHQQRSNAEHPPADPLAHLARRNQSDVATRRQPRGHRRQRRAPARFPRVAHRRPARENDPPKHRE